MKRLFDTLNRPAHILLLRLVLCVLLLSAASLPDDRTLQRSEGKRWQTAVTVAHKSAKSAARQFLEERNQVLSPPALMLYDVSTCRCLQVFMLATSTANSVDVL